MNDQTVNNIGVLSLEEKEKLQRKLKEYHLKINQVEYSQKLTKFFSIHKAQPLLTKLQKKKAKEEVIPKLTRPAIK